MLQKQHLKEQFKKLQNDKITSIGKPKEKGKTKEVEKIHIPPEKRQQVIDDLRLF